LKKKKIDYESSYSSEVIFEKEKGFIWCIKDKIWYGNLIEVK